MSKKPELIASFAPKYAGERIGWSSVEELETDTPDHRKDYLINIGTATVGSAGALFIRSRKSSPEYTEDKIIYDQEGFIAVAALSAIVSKDEDVTVDNFAYAQEGMSPLARVDLLARGAQNTAGSQRINGFKDVGDRLWAKDSEELVDNIKTQLEEAGIQEGYPAVYYGLNGFIAPPGRIHDPFKAMGPQEYLVSDREMRETTSEQLLQSRIILASLATALTFDEDAHYSLSGFNNATDQEKLRIFKQNRSEIDVIRYLVKKHAGKLVVPQAVLPPEASLSARIASTHRAKSKSNNKKYKRFNNFMTAPKRPGSVEEAREFLDDEISDISIRIFHANHGSNRLRSLSRLESNE